MRALAKTASGKGNVELRDALVPGIGEDDALMEVSLCGVCGGDLHIDTGLHAVQYRCGGFRKTIRSSDFVRA